MAEPECQEQNGTETAHDAESSERVGGEFDVERTGLTQHFDISDLLPERISILNLVKMPIAELRDMLIFTGLDPIGRKQELVQRLKILLG